MQRAAECRRSASRAPLSLLSALQTQKEKASFGGLAGRKPQPQADERYRDRMLVQEQATLSEPWAAQAHSIRRELLRLAGALSELVGLVQWDL